ncbi:MAG TPA: 2-dehydropantoate 2-reductase [Rhizomicrobium sp.]|jgi:2-dehydropantoate 2-reductase|nr:2-dehydropantoate 2-reductase [Rhizomicrobium sp.]
MKVVVIGAGAIGGWIAGLLADAKWDVSLLARGQTLSNIRERGLRVRRKDAERTYKLRASDDAGDLGNPDYVIVAVKGQSVPSLAPAIRSLLGPDTAVVPALNGVPWWFFQVPGVPLQDAVVQSVDPGGALSKAISPERVIGCVVHASAWTPEPGVVELNGEDKLLFGEPDGAQRERTVTLAAAFGSSSVKPVVSANIRLDIWTKLWGNMTMNPLSVLTGATTGRMLDNPDVRALIRAMMLEMQAIGTRIGLPLAMTPEDRMAITRKLGDFETSMLRDAEAGRDIETAPILGALVEIANGVEEPAPFIRAVAGLLKVRA